MRKLALFNIFLTLLVITLGALTRLLDAGLGCPDWPVCYGQLIPQENQASAEFIHWQFDSLKAWMEMTHRYVASLLGLSIVIQALLLWPRYLGAVRYLSIFLCLWVVMQGMFGMWTVTLRLWPPVVSAHLLGGAITLGAQFMVWRVLTSNREPKVLSVWSAFALVVFLQMGLGAWTSSQYAGLVCPDFPTCQGNWWVNIDAGVLQAPMMAGDEYLGGVLGMADKMAVQWLHRLGALVVVLMFFYLALQKNRQRRSVVFCLGFLCLQITLGILNAIWMLPLSLALLHNTVAMLLWLSALNGMTAKEIEMEAEEPTEELLA